MVFSVFWLWVSTHRNSTMSVQNRQMDIISRFLRAALKTVQTPLKFLSPCEITSPTLKQLLTTERYRDNWSGRWLWMQYEAKGNSGLGPHAPVNVFYFYCYVYFWPLLQISPFKWCGVFNKCRHLITTQQESVEGVQCSGKSIFFVVNRLQYFFRCGLCEL